MKQRCPHCQTAYETASLFCEECGQKLPATPDKQQTVIAPPPFLDPPPAPTTSDMPKEAVAVRTLPAEPVPPTPPIEPAPNTLLIAEPTLCLQFENGETIKLTESEQYFVGRTDAASGWYPAVDLALYGGEKGGVSRRHACFFYENNLPHLEDIGSSNGTYINGKRLETNKPHLLQPNDEIRFGKIVVHLQ